MSQFLKTWKSDDPKTYGVFRLNVILGTANLPFALYFCLSYDFWFLLSAIAVVWLGWLIWEQVDHERDRQEFFREDLA